MYRKAILTCLVLTAIAAVAGFTTVAAAETFRPAPYLADAQVDVLSRSVANAQLERDLFGQPYATVIVGNVDVYAGFPYLEAHYFQVVSDPAWNRLLFGELDRGLNACDGTDTPFGHLAEPRGLTADGTGRIWVADTGNDRVLCFQAVTEYDHIALEPLFAVDNLNAPFDVAYSDGGTPGDPADDRLYVANTGRNEVRSYALTDGGAQLAATLGDLGSGPGEFAGPLALSVGHRDGAHTDDVYVADAHNGRLVHLRDAGSTLAWVDARRHDLGPVTSLATDHNGNVYAAAPDSRSLVKCTADLAPLATSTSGFERPRGLHVPFVTVTDHRDGSTSRAGEGRALVVEEWSGEHGIRVVDLGVELADAVPVSGDRPAVDVTLTDHARVVAEIVDPGDRRVLARRDAGVLAAGRQQVAFDAADYRETWDAGRYLLRLRAVSTYDETVSADLELTVELAAGGGVAPQALALLGNAPNPFNPSTVISFSIPAGSGGEHTLNVYDTRGRLVRSLGSGPVAPGRHTAIWDGADQAGRTVGSGVYFYRLEFAGEALTGKMVLVK